MHIWELLIVIGVALAIFGPKTLQSLARNAGKTTGEVKNAKDKFMSHVPADDITKLRETLNKVPTSPAHAAQMLMTPDEKKEKAPATRTDAAVNPEAKTVPAKEN
ncbi:hypothetical protein KDH_61980 [Dictyobacter sp. S3.2.2.5]|uniref:Sec-independent protein translocase protein TatA n=1 Tax=Dictyobacter halimunensis TaxID=3026934 RepID=A0ABQ6FYL5_9CHLR|nr:hypothetical protein KDH_61980 [Dictyobacter sp. S3.2.2.5]